MLDVSTQVAILRVLKRLAAESDLSVIYISHDISTVSYVCHEINVMYLGNIVETAPTEELLENPQHPYTRELLRAIPIPDPDHDQTRSNIPENPPDPVNLPSGCNLKDRCPDRMDICDEEPILCSTDENHRTKCHLHYDHEQHDSQATDQEYRAVSDGGRE